MSKSTLKLKHLEILNLTLYFQKLEDDILQDEEDIVDLVYEVAEESKFLFRFLILLSNGSIIYFEYNSTTKKITKILKNTILKNIITNDINYCEISFTLPIVLSTSLNEIIFLDAKEKPCKAINISEENLLINSNFCESQILNLKFNCTRNAILVTTLNQLLIYKLHMDKYENKQVLHLFGEIKLNGLYKNLDFSKILDYKLIHSFSYFNENVIYFCYLTESKISEEFSRVSLETDEGTKGNLFCNFVKVTINKKDTTQKVLQCFKVDSTIVKISVSNFFEKIYFLFEDGIITLLNSKYLKKPALVADKAPETNVNPASKPRANANAGTTNNNFNKQTPQDEVFDSKFNFKYVHNSEVKLTDLFFHSSSNFIVARDAQLDYLIFDFTMNLYYVMQNSKITVKLNMNSFKSNANVKQFSEKVFTINTFFKEKLKISGDLDDVILEKEIVNAFQAEKNNSNLMVFYDARVINGIFIEISTKFEQEIQTPQIIDEIQLLKNHLRGQNFESSFKILMMIQNFNLWIQCFILICNKLCQSSSNILLVKRHTLNSVLDYLNDKIFEEEFKIISIQNLKVFCLTSIVFKCLNSKQYEYAYLIAEKLNLPFLYKIIKSHSKLNGFLGVSYMCCTKLEETQSSDNDDSVINDLNKIITNSNYVLSISNLQVLLKDIDHLLENNNLNSDYLRENNSLEINLQKYNEALKFEIEGKFEEAKDIYKKNNLNYDYMRVDKLVKEINTQINDINVMEFCDY